MPVTQEIIYKKWSAPAVSIRLPSDCNLLSLPLHSVSPPFFPPLLSLWHIWITYHFPDCAQKKVKHSLPFYFLTDLRARSLPVLAEMGPGQRRVRIRGRKLREIFILFLLSGQTDLTLCKWRQVCWDIWHALWHRGFFRSCQTEPYIFDGEYIHLKFIFIAARQRLGCMYGSQLFIFFTACPFLRSALVH